MKAGFLFTNRSTARRVLEPAEYPPSSPRPKRRIASLMTAVLTRLLAR